MDKVELVKLFGKNKRQAALALGLLPTTIGEWPDKLGRVQLKNIAGALLMKQETRPEFVPEALWKAIKE